MAYNNLDVFGHCGYTRKIIFQLFMKLRANGKFHLGVEEERGAAVHFSPYLICRSPMKVWKVKVNKGVGFFQSSNIS